MLDKFNKSTHLECFTGILSLYDLNIILNINIEKYNTISEKFKNAYFNKT